jgi:hypothetical protein
VWYVVWDDPRAADRFTRTAGPPLSRTKRAAYKAQFDTLTVAGRPAIRYVLAPGQWSRWAALPAASVGKGS